MKKVYRPISVHSDRRQSTIHVIANPVRTLDVAIRFLLKKLNFQRFWDADSHTSDIGHWFGMTGFEVCLHLEQSGDGRSAFGFTE